MDDNAETKLTHVFSVLRHLLISFLFECITFNVPRNTNTDANKSIISKPSDIAIKVMIAAEEIGLKLCSALNLICHS